MGVAQLVEHLVVVQEVAGSSPVTHPVSWGNPTCPPVAPKLPLELVTPGRSLSAASEEREKHSTTRLLLSRQYDVVFADQPTITVGHKVPDERSLDSKNCIRTEVFAIPVKDVRGERLESLR